MINVEIYIPAFDVEYDFRLDEYAKVNVLIAEIAEMVCRHEQRDMPKDIGQFALCDVQKQVIFNKSMTLKGYGVENGERLLLV